MYGLYKTMADKKIFNVETHCLEPLLSSLALDVTERVGEGLLGLDVESRLLCQYIRAYNFKIKHSFYGHGRAQRVNSLTVLVRTTRNLCYVLFSNKKMRELCSVMASKVISARFWKRLHATYR